MHLLILLLIICTTPRGFGGEDKGSIRYELPRKPDSANCGDSGLFFDSEQHLHAWWTEEQNPRPLVDPQYTDKSQPRVLKIQKIGSTVLQAISTGSCTTSYVAPLPQRRFLIRTGSRLSVYSPDLSLISSISIPMDVRRRDVTITVFDHGSKVALQSRGFGNNDLAVFDAATLKQLAGWHETDEEQVQFAFHIQAKAARGKILGRADYAQHWKPIYASAEKSEIPQFRVIGERLIVAEQGQIKIFKPTGICFSEPYPLPTLWSLSVARSSGLQVVGFLKASVNGWADTGHIQDLRVKIYNTQECRTVGEVRLHAAKWDPGGWQFAVSQDGHEIFVLRGSILSVFTVPRTNVVH